MILIVCICIRSRWSIKNDLQNENCDTPIKLIRNEATDIMHMYGCIKLCKAQSRSVPQSKDSK